MPTFSSCRKETVGAIQCRAAREDDNIHSAVKLGIVSSIYSIERLKRIKSLKRLVEVSRGRFTYNGLFGVEAANQMCKDSYPNSPTARMYFSHDIDEALVNNLVEGDNRWNCLLDV